ncbi:hypothetical protein [Microbispora bryophytorum]|uniref:hypothetical protein n=1 Tax=Microbispora bryophytorum TaxID=1460882 RepID=UPI0033CBB91C
MDRREDDADRRRAIVSIAEVNREAVDAWLARGARAWRSALEPLTSEQRRVLAETLRSYERAITGDGSDRSESRLACDPSLLASQLAACSRRVK